MKKVFIGLGFFLLSAPLFAGTYGSYGNSLYSNYSNNSYITYPTDGYSYAYNTYQNTQNTSYYNDYSYNNSPSYERPFGYASVVDACPTSLYRNLSLGSESQEVFTLQDYLHDSGYLVPEPNGYFGYGTRDAVMHFQADHGIRSTGTVGPQTMAALNSAMCGGDSFAHNVGGSYENVYTDNNAWSSTVQIPTTYVSSPVAVNTITAPIPTYTPSTSGPTPIYNSPAVTTPVVVNAPTQNNIAYYPYDPFSNNPLPLPATLTITSPLNNSVYKEGDQISATWVSTNANVISYKVTFENFSVRQEQVIATLPGNQTSYSFTLTKALLDYVCGGQCDVSMQQNFRLNVVATLSQNNGVTSELKATVKPIVVQRPYFYGAGVALTPSKTPISSGEIIDLIVSTPIGNLWNSGLFGPFTISIRATCPVGVTATINGVPCGSTYTINQATAYFVPTIQAQLTNTTYVPQIVNFQLTVTNGANGQVVGNANAFVVVQK